MAAGRDAGSEFTASPGRAKAQTRKVHMWLAEGRKVHYVCVSFKQSPCFNVTCIYSEDLLILKWKALPPSVCGSG